MSQPSFRMLETLTGAEEVALEELPITLLRNDDICVYLFRRAEQPKVLPAPTAAVYAAVTSVSPPKLYIY